MSSAEIGPEGLSFLEDGHFPEGRSPDHPDLVSARSLFGGRLNSAGVRSGHTGEGAFTVVFDFPGSGSPDQEPDDC